MRSLRVRLAAVAAGVIVLLSGAVAGASPAAAITLPPGAVGPFQIRSLHNGRCLDEPWRAGGAPNGTQLQLWDCINGRGQVNQHWYLVLVQWAWQHNLGRRYLLINGHSGRCLDAVWNGPNGLPVVVWDCYYNFQNANQLWHVWNADHSGSGAISDLNGRIVDAAWDRINGNGTPIQLWDNLGPRPNQSWYLQYNF